MTLNSKRFWQSQGSDEDARVFLIEDGFEQSYAQVFANGDALMAGCKRGLVAILCDKSAATVTAYFGALRNGLVPLLLDADAKPAALNRIFAAYRPDYVFDPQGRGHEGIETVADLNAATLSASTEQQTPVPHPDNAVLLATSGSTGDPKFVRLSHNSLDTCTRSICDYLGLTHTRRCISLLPLHYSYGLSVLNTAAAARASFVISNHSVLDKDLWRLMAELGVTDLSGVPFIFEMLRRIRVPAEALQALECVTQAGGRLDPKLTRHFREKFGAEGIRFFTMYGQTEASPRISYLPPERAAEKEGSVGVPISCGEALIAETKAASGEGELLYRGTNVALGYAYSREDIARGDEFGGSLLTGDQVRIDDEGFIFIVGRRKRFVKLQGVSVNLDHVENLLKEANLDCIVVGRENLIIVCHLENMAEEITAVVAENFAFHPTTFRLQEVDTLTMNSNGKPDYAALSAQFL